MRSLEEKVVCTVKSVANYVIEQLIFSDGSLDMNLLVLKSAERKFMYVMSISVDL